MAERMFRLRLVLLLCILSWARPVWADTRTDARRYFQQGMALIDEGRPLEGIELLKKAYSLRPHASVLFNIARAYATAGELDRSVEYFERYLDAEPSDAEKVQGTLRDLKERQRLRSIVDEGMTAIAQGRHIEGIALLRRAYDARPHPNILYNIARAYEDAGDTRRAITAYERYLKSNPKDDTNVRATLRKLRAAAPKTKPPKPKIKKNDPVTPEVEEPVVEEPEDISPPEDLEAERIEHLSQIVADMLKREEAVKPVTPAIGEAPMSEGKINITATATPAAPVELEAKGGEAYEEVVFTASRRAQSPIDAPNAVTILSEEDIRLSGARSIPDLLRRVPGMDVMSMSYSDFNVAVRGFNRRIANKVLVLIDGRTVYEDFIGGMVWRGQTIDLGDIARIEVVRGPGSAIYGAYAFNGIVNIITKRPEDINGSVGRVALGNGETLETSYQYGKKHGPVGVRASVGYERGNKYEQEFDPTRVDFRTDARDPTRSLDVVRFDLTTEYNLTEDRGRIFVGGGARAGLTEVYGVASLRNQSLDGNAFNLRGGYDGKLFSLLAFWNGLRADNSPQFARVGVAGLQSRVHADSLAIEPIFRPTFQLLGEHALVIGGEFRHKYIDWDYLDGAQHENFFGAFAQDTWAISDFVQVIVSARVDRHPSIGPLFSPRAAVIVRPSERQAIRASFGTAYRQPTQAENFLKLNAPGPVAGVAIRLEGDRALVEENIASAELGYMFQPDFGEFEVVGWVNQVRNLITRTALIPTGLDAPFDPVAGGFVSFVTRNQNDSRRFIALGTEVSARLYPSDGLDVGGSYAFQYISDQDSGERFTDSPLHKATVWGQLRTSLGLDFGMSLHFVSAQQWVEPTFTADGLDDTPLPVDAAVVVLGRIGYRTLDDQLELAISGTNLTDVGSLRHREHPFANRLEARIFGSMTARF